MSIYDQRESPAYRNDFRVYRNRNFDKWWSAAHDQLIAQLIEKYQWNWYWEISDSIGSVTPRDVMDSLSQQSAWYNKVMYYAITRAEDIGLTKTIRTSERKTCPLCGESFQEESLPHPLVKRLGIGHLDFCSPCLKDRILSTGSDTATRTEIVDFLNQLTVVLERVPAQGVGEGMDDLIDLPFDKRLELLLLLKDKPSVKRVKEIFGSWLKALIDSGALIDGTRETPRGIHTIALDGHTCLSLGEKTIDDYLYRRGIPHHKEPKYPEGNYRADFLVGDVFIEYFGLTGDATYDVRAKEKIRLCKVHGIRLIALYPKDLITMANIEKRLGELEQQTNVPCNAILSAGASTR
ncbi:MAG: hypothetical protein ACLQHK_01250 [Gallionellaceae bacterium]